MPGITNYYNVHRENSPFSDKPGDLLMKYTNQVQALIDCYQYLFPFGQAQSRQTHAENLKHLGHGLRVNTTNTTAMAPETINSMVAKRVAAYATLSRQAPGEGQDAAQWKMKVQNQIKGIEGDYQTLSKTAQMAHVKADIRVAITTAPAPAVVQTHRMQLR